MGKIIGLNGKELSPTPVQVDSGIPPGEYVCRLKEVSATRVDGGFLLKSKFNIQEGPFAGKNLFSYASFTDRPVKVRHNMPKAEELKDGEQVQGNQDKVG